MDGGREGQGTKGFLGRGGKERLDLGESCSSAYGVHVRKF